jgi:hypothetical protein
MRPPPHIATMRLERPVCMLCALVLMACSGGGDGEEACASREIPIHVECATQTQLCEPPLRYVCEGGGGTLDAEFVASSGHCSEMRFRLALDGVEQPPSEFLGPGQSTGVLRLGPIPKGGRVITVQAEGRVSGCNTGFLQSWAGRLRLLVTEGG